MRFALADLTFNLGLEPLIPPLEWNCDQECPYGRAEEENPEPHLRMHDENLPLAGLGLNPTGDRIKRIGGSPVGAVLRHGLGMPVTEDSTRDFQN